MKSWISEERYSAISGTILSITLFVAVVLVLFGLIPELIWDMLSKHSSSGARLFGFAAVFSGMVAALAGYWSRLPTPLQQGATRLTTRLKGYLLDLVSLAAIVSMAVAAGYFVRWYTTEPPPLPPFSEQTSTGDEESASSRVTPASSIDAGQASAAGVRSAENNTEQDDTPRYLPDLYKVRSASAAAVEAARNLAILRETAPEGQVETERQAGSEGPVKSELDEKNNATSDNSPDQCGPAGSAPGQGQLQSLEQARKCYEEKKETFREELKKFQKYEAEVYQTLWQVLWLPFSLVVLTAIMLALLAGANRSSLHSVYANRLIRAYLGTTRTGRVPKWPTDYDEDDDIPLNQVPYCRERQPLPLFPVVNMTVNFKGGRGEKGRKGASFTATPLHVGSAMLGEGGYVDTGNAVRSSNNRGMTLGRAMTIAGAAASPNMGYYGRALVAFAMSILNIRLGWWFPNPAKLDKNHSGEPKALAFEPKLGVVLYAIKEAFGVCGPKTSGSISPTAGTSTISAFMRWCDDAAMKSSSWMPAAMALSNMKTCCRRCAGSRSISESRSNCPASFPDKKEANPASAC